MHVWFNNFIDNPLMSHFTPFGWMNIYSAFINFKDEQCSHHSPGHIAYYGQKTDTNSFWYTNSIFLQVAVERCDKQSPQREESLNVYGKWCCLQQILRNLGGCQFYLLRTHFHDHTYHSLSSDSRTLAYYYSLCLL